MSTLSARLDDVTKVYWDTWRAWRLGLGWGLGPDNAAAKMSPHLVDKWEELSPDGAAWFRQHAALVLHAVDVVSGAVVALENALPVVALAVTEAQTRAAKKLKSALSAIKVADKDLASKKLRVALKLLEPFMGEHVEILRLIGTAQQHLSEGKMLDAGRAIQGAHTKLTMKITGTVPATKPVAKKARSGRAA